MMDRTQPESMLGDAAFVRLSARQGRKFYTLVDREDFQRVTDQTWRFEAGYAMSTKDGTRLHSFIMKAQPGQVLDHINGDRLDNRKQNLRFVTHAENAKNCTRPTFPGKTSRFKGVCWDFRRFAALGLLVFIFLKILTLFGLPTYFAIPSIDWQAFGVFVAGTAYALGVKQ